MFVFYDTSAILYENDVLNTARDILISPITLNELEHLKHNENSMKAYHAREAIRKIISNHDIIFTIENNHKIDKMIKKYTFLSNINDHRLICSAELEGIHRHEIITFKTCDAAQSLFAHQMPHLQVEFLNETSSCENNCEWTGYNKYYPNDQDMAMLYTDPKINILKCRQNEFAKIYDGPDLKDVLFWTGGEYRKLKYKEFTSPIGEKIKPRNLEQKMYLDLLQNDDIPVKLCVGKFGTGKSMFAETWAAHMVVAGKYDKIVFVKNNLEVKGAGKLGILPGNEIEKQYPWLRQLEDHLGPQLFEEFLQDGRIEPAHLSTLRGRDLKNCIILVDEAENLLDTNIQLLLGRVGEGSIIIFCADIKQCDYANEKMSGLPKLISRLAGNKLFGMIQLVKTERSEVAALADCLD